MKIEYTYFQPFYGSLNSFIYILTFILFLFVVIAFIKSKGDVINPSFLYSTCLAGCCLLSAIYTKIWNLPMHFNTAIIIVTMSLFFFLGAFLAEYCCKIDIDKKIYISYSAQAFCINWRIWVFFILLMSFFAYLNYEEFLSVARQVTSAIEFKDMLRPVIKGLAHQEIELTRWNAYRLRFATGMAYVSILAVWINLLAHRYKEVLKWGCFVLLYIPFMVLTGGRQQFMYLIIYGMDSFFIIYRKYNLTKRLVRKELAIVGIATVIFLCCFLGIGIVSGKIDQDANFFKVLVHYAGINIAAFDVYINEMVMPDNHFIGTTTLGSIYGFIKARGFDVPHYTQYIPFFTSFGPVTTNVYSAFFRYIHDFGYLGCALIMFLIGFFYTFLYRKLYCEGLKNWMILVFSSIIYPVLLMGREERFLNEIITTSEISFLIGILILYKFFEFFSERGINAK